MVASACGMAGEAVVRQPDGAEVDGAGGAVGDDLDRGEIVEIVGGDGIGDLLHAVLRRIEHQHRVALLDAGQQGFDIGDPQIDDDEFVNCRACRRR